MLLRSELHGCLERVKSFLIKAGATLGASLVAPEASLPLGLNVDTDIGKEDLYGGFSPRARPSPQLEPHVSSASESKVTTEVRGPVMMTMPELQKLCGESCPPLSMLHREEDTLGASEVASTAPSLEPSQPLVSETLFAKELNDLLIGLEEVSPGSGKEIARLISEKDTEGKIKRVKEYLRRKSKKSCANRKASAAA
jgi:hypothetical protein